MTFKLYNADYELSKWIDKKSKYFVNEPSNNVSSKLAFSIGFLIKEENMLNMEFNFCTYMIKDVRDRSENKAIYYTMLRNVYRIMRSLKEQKEFFLVLRRHLENYAVKHQKLLDMIKRSIKSGRERVDRLRKDILPEYIEASGLEKYQEYLLSQDTDLGRDLNRYFRDKFETMDSVNIDLDDKEKFNVVYESYVSYIKLNMAENNIEFVDMTDKLTKYEQMIQDKRDKAAEDKNKEHIELAIQDNKAMITHATSILYNAFEKGSVLKKYSKITSTHAIETIYSRVLDLDLKDNFFYVIIGARVCRKGCKSGLIYYNKDKGFCTFPFTGVAEIFTSDELDKVNKIIEITSKEFDSKKYVYSFEVMKIHKTDIKEIDNTAKDVVMSFQDTILANRSLSNSIYSNMEKFAPYVIKEIRRCIHNHYSYEKFKYKELIPDTIYMTLLNNVQELFEEESGKYIYIPFILQTVNVNQYNLCSPKQLISDGTGYMRFYPEYDSYNFKPLPYYKLSSFHDNKLFSISNIKYMYMINDLKQIKNLEESTQIKKFVSDNLNFKISNSVLYKIYYKPIILERSIFEETGGRKIKQCKDKIRRYLLDQLHSYSSEYDKKKARVLNGKIERKLRSKHSYSLETMLSELEMVKYSANQLKSPCLYGDEVWNDLFDIIKNAIKEDN